MDRYKNYVKIEEIRELLRQGKNEEALELTDGMDPAKIKGNYDCSVLAQVYLHNGMLNKAKECFLVMYDRQKSRRVAMELVNLSIRLKQPDDAETYYSEYKELAPNDYYNYIFRYKIDRLKNRPLEELAASLEALKEAEFFDNWGYELAKVYHRMGNEEKCVKTCDEVILWFGDGDSVERAKALKAYYQGELTLKEMSEKTAAKFEDGEKPSKKPEDSSPAVRNEAEGVKKEVSGDTRHGNKAGEDSTKNRKPAVENAENLGETRLAPGGWITKEALEALEKGQPVENLPEAGQEDLKATRQDVQEPVKTELQKTPVSAENDAASEASGKTVSAKKMTRAQKKAEKKKQRREAYENKKAENSEFMAAVDRELGFIDNTQHVAEAPKNYNADVKETEKNPETEAPSETVKKENVKAAEAKQKEVSDEEELASLVDQIFAEESVEKEEEDKPGNIRTLKPGKSVEPQAGSRIAQLLESTGKTLEDYFGFFACRKDMAAQIISALETMLNPESKSICYCIIGERGSGKKALVNGFAEVMKAAGILGNVQIVWTEAAKINEISLKDRAVKLIGRCMVIDRAGGLLEEAANDLASAGKSFGNKTVIVLTDYRKNLMELLNGSRELGNMFATKINIPSFGPGDLLQLAEYKLVKAEFRIDTRAYERLAMKIKGISRATGEGALARTEKYVMNLIDNAEQRNAADYIKQTMEGEEHVQNDTVLLCDLPEEI